ncbi:arsenate reductase ArsC, partial [Bacteroides ovatus]
MKILILCSDNSCLSQMAQGWLQSFDKSLTVAGISPAIEVHPLAVQTLASSGIDIS